MRKFKDERAICKCDERTYHSKGCLCVKCSLKSNKPMSDNAEMGNYDAVYETGPGNFDVRLKHGFQLLQESELQDK